MIKLLFVCHGNICRSPMAEYIMKDMVKREGIDRAFEIASAATSFEEIGNPVYPPAKRELARRGISCAGHAARHMGKSDYAKYDLIYCMDNWNMRNMLRITGGDPEGKMFMLGGEREIEDPWYTDRFAEVAAQIEEGCERILEDLRRKGSI